MSSEKNHVPLPLHLDTDYNYFSELWEYKSKTNHHTTEKWDARAKDWAIELSENSCFQQSNRERVLATTAYLRQNDLLQPGDTVIDIGCGPGRFAVEFAHSVKEVYASDISQNMIDLAKKYAQRQHIDNMTYMVNDFTTLNVQEMNWNRKFDLVFTSITPAIGTLAGLEKINSMSCGHVFNSCYIYQSDSLEKSIAHEVFHTETAAKRAHSHWYYALFNLLWLQGYFPLTHYFKQDRTETLDCNDMLIRYYTRLFEHVDDIDKQNKIASFLSSHSKDNQIVRNTQHHYGWLLWNVNHRVERI